MHIPFLRALATWLGERHPATLVRLRYLARFHRLPRLRHPRDLNEKILHLKLYSDTSLWTLCADKYRVRQYLEERGFGQYLVELYGAWERVEDIDFDSLPPQLIFKANNGDGKGQYLIVDDLPHADRQMLRATLGGWLRQRHIGALSAEPQYKGIPPMIVAEQLLPPPAGETSLIDYKIWCLGGKARYILICDNRQTDSGAVDLMLYDLAWTPHPELMRADARHPQGRILSRPKGLTEMISVAERMAQPFPEVRVDLYNIDGRIYFGELTFTSLGGMMNYFTPECLRRMGEMVPLNKPAK